MKKMKKDQNGFSPVEGILLFVIVGILGFTSWFVVRNRNAANKQYDKIASTENVISVKDDSKSKVVQLKETEIATLKQTPTKSTSAASNPSTSTTTKTQTSAPAAAPSTPAASSGYSITISADGCSVSGYSVAGNSIEIGAFSTNKGGSVVYDFTTNETITKSSGGFKGMTAFGKTVDAQGVILAYHSATITADSCPAAG